MAVVTAISSIGGASPVLALQASQATPKDCNRTSTGLVALSDLGTGQYQGFQGGLYPGGSSVMPTAHAVAGIARASNIQPRDAAGNPSNTGKIALISVGVSNTNQEFAPFVKASQDDPDMNPAVTLVNGAQSGEEMKNWISVDALTWQKVDEELARFDLTPPQVQAAWIKLPEPVSTGTFPEHAEQYRDGLEEVLRTIKVRYPNIQTAFLSSRIYGGYGFGVNPEPYAYENGFAVKWVIEDQINGDPGLNFDPEQGEVLAPWIGWGPYLWADGLGPDDVIGGVGGRSDGFEWTCDDYRGDGLHPSRPAQRVVAEILMDFFKTDPVASGWFLAGGPVVTTPSSALAPPTTTGPGQSSTTSSAVESPATTGTTATLSTVVTTSIGTDQGSATTDTDKLPLTAQRLGVDQWWWLLVVGLVGVAVGAVVGRLLFGRRLTTSGRRR